MQLQIHSLTEKSFQQLENFCKRANVKIKYGLVTDDIECYDVTIINFQNQCFLGSCKSDDTLLLTSFDSEIVCLLDSSEFHKVVII